MPELICLMGFYRPRAQPSFRHAQKLHLRLWPAILPLPPTVCVPVECSVKFSLPGTLTLTARVIWT